jgi:hypothetical protein
LHARYRQFPLVLLAGSILATALPAQERLPQVPLTNWASPLYWHPSEDESSVVTGWLKSRAAAANADVTPAVSAAVSPSTPLVFVAMTPCRIMDTRPGQGQVGAFGPPTLAGGNTRTVPVPTHPTCGVPLAAAYSINVTVIPQGPLGYLTVWPTGQPQPRVSTLNASAGQIVANAAIVPAGTGGDINIFVTDATDVVVDINGYYAPPGDLNGNTALGVLTLQNSSGTGNTAVGNAALQNNGSRSQNTATGDGALNGNTNGTQNTADGYQALFYNTIGSSNTAVGYQALWDNTTGSYNTATGYQALQGNNVGTANTATGYDALMTNTFGSSNTATGSGALMSNTTGLRNTATGAQALKSNTTGPDNTSIGNQALASTTLGGGNTAVGSGALMNNTTGDQNIAIGYNAAAGVSGGANFNIHLGTRGASVDSGTIRIGGSTALGDSFAQTQFFVAGVRSVTTGRADAVPVMIDSNGQLGIISSSRTVKRDIENMGDTTGTIMGLRPVRFRYKVYGPDSPEQYGLIAKEVAEVAPDLVVRNRDGKIETVFYDKVNAMLLNQVQTEQRLIESLKDQVRWLEDRLAKIESRIGEK